MLSPDSGSSSVVVGEDEVVPLWDDEVVGLVVLDGGGSDVGGEVVGSGGGVEVVGGAEVGGPGGGAGGGSGSFGVDPGGSGVVFTGSSVVDVGPFVVEPDSPLDGDGGAGGGGDPGGRGSMLLEEVVGAVVAAGGRGFADESVCWLASATVAAVAKPVATARPEAASAATRLPIPSWPCIGSIGLPLVRPERFVTARVPPGVSGPGKSPETVGHGSGDSGTAGTPGVGPCRGRDFPANPS
ncbi:hypothetical protein GIY23_17380 [Allosaccharopolyspora coralli]|uniref:Uncharacterized protein n=1 Tax=Allosaccharopolyspora coralli TaxID=2665642 RepID=A0A5Q3QJQ8_9PSEU|nr:hypothetical protein [Allosaccharopolyspora coralli]QGK71057.1 hypothetical protein GIY23_17380 [Allosaccharopolyspora coralli]